VSITKRGSSYLVRVAPFTAQTVYTRADAERLELELKRQRSMGPLSEASSITLGDAIDGVLRRIEATQGLRDKTVTYNRQSAKFWDPLRPVRLATLRRSKIEDAISERAGEHPRSAKNEFEFLKRVLHDAKGRTQRVDESIFEIPPVKARPRKGRALTVAQLHELASWCPDYAARLILLAGQIGFRQTTWFRLTDQMVDLDKGTITTPGNLAKSDREHVIHVGESGLALLREQLDSRPDGTPLVFPTPEGKPWTHNNFRDRVWVPARIAAARNDPDARGGTPSVFEGSTLHMLRHTAASLMGRARLDAAAASERMDHSDGGALYLKTYRHLYDGEKRAQAQRFDDFVQSELDKEWTKDPGENRDRPDHEDPRSGQYWDRTSDPSRVKRVLSR
jgi:integrase